MPADDANKEIEGAVLNYVQHGAYPESEDVIAAELRASAFPGVLDGLRLAREQLKVCFPFRIVVYRSLKPRARTRFEA